MREEAIGKPNSWTFPRYFKPELALRKESLSARQPMGGSRRSGNVTDRGNFSAGKQQ